MNHILIKKFLYTKDPYPKYCLLINKRESTAMKYLNAFKAFIKYSNYMDDIYKNIEEYNPNEKRVFITKSYFADPINSTLDWKHILLWKFQTKKILKKLHLIIHQILTFKTLWIFKESSLC